jgi:hypothetical protein
MNIVFTITVPRTHKIKNKPNYHERSATEEDELAKVFPFQNVYATMDIKDLKELLNMLHENDFIVAREFMAKTKFDGTKYIEDRGEVIINCQMIGKIKPYFE